MTLKNAALFALIGTMLLAILVVATFIRDILALGNGILPAVTVLKSLIHAIASVSVAVFFYVFHKSQ